ncbi:MAG: DNA-binding protein [Pseudomonadales bacterium]|nr:DNA-binding protein [Pseudomonadales bacterium]
MARSVKQSALATPLVAPIRPPRVTISQVVRAAAERYLEQPGNDERTDLYELVLVEVERALLEATLAHTEDNQSETSRILGLNRGTLRKKLGKYGLL